MADNPESVELLPTTTTLHYEDETATAPHEPGCKCFPGRDDGVDPPDDWETITGGSPCVICLDTRYKELHSVIKDYSFLPCCFKVCHRTCFWRWAHNHSIHADDPFEVACPHCRHVYKNAAEIGVVLWVPNNFKPGYPDHPAEQVMQEEKKKMQPASDRYDKFLQIYPSHYRSEYHIGTLCLKCDLRAAQIAKREFLFSFDLPYLVPHPSLSLASNSFFKDNNLVTAYGEWLWEKDANDEYHWERERVVPPPPPPDHSERDHYNSDPAVFRSTIEHRLAWPGMPIPKPYTIAFRLAGAEWDYRPLRRKYAWEFTLDPDQPVRPPPYGHALWEEYARDPISWVSRDHPWTRNSPSNPNVATGFANQGFVSSDSSDEDNADVDAGSVNFEIEINGQPAPEQLRDEIAALFASNLNDSTRPDQAPASSGNAAPRTPPRRRHPRPDVIAEINRVLAARESPTVDPVERTYVRQMTADIPQAPRHPRRRVLLQRRRNPPEVVAISSGRGEPTRLLVASRNEPRTTFQELLGATGNPSTANPYNFNNFDWPPLPNIPGQDGDSFSGAALAEFINLFLGRQSPESPPPPRTPGHDSSSGESGEISLPSPPTPSNNDGEQ